MNTPANTLRKLRLQCDLTFPDQNPDDHQHPFEIEIISGIGPTGLAPIEYQLEKAIPGDTIEIDFSTEPVDQVLGHLLAQFSFAPGMETAEQMKMTVLAVDTASDREVVKSLAQAIKCGCGCGC